MLHRELSHQGQRLYRWRGFLPLLLIPFIAFGFREFRYPFGSHRFDLIWEGVCLGFAFLGLAIRFIVFGYAPPGSSHVGQSTKNPDKKKFKTAGVYSVCRHPLYLGNFFMGFGVLLFLGSIVVMAIYVLLFVLYYERLILGEEEFLKEKYGEEYAAWANCTPLICPKLSRWKRPDFPFSWKAAIRREYKRIFAVIAIFTLFEIVGDLVVEGKLKLELRWAVLFFCGLVFYLTVRIMKRKKSRLIQTPPR